MVNVEFLIITYIIGLSVDWILQSDWQAINKSKWNRSESDNKLLSGLALITHSQIYSITTSLIVSMVVNLNIYQYTIMIIVLFISHAIIDTRIPVKAIMRLKGMKEDQINDHINYGFMHIGIDQRLHELVIFILAIII